MRNRCCNLISVDFEVAAAILETRLQVILKKGLQYLSPCNIAALRIDLFIIGKLLFYTERKMSKDWKIILLLEDKTVVSQFVTTRSENCDLIGFLP